MSRIYQAFLKNESAIRRIFARYFSTPEDVEELTQEVFLRCFAAEAKTKIDDPKAFLFRSAKNLAFCELKKKYRTTTDYLEDSGGLEVLNDEQAASAERQLDSRQKMLALTEAIAKLPPEWRRAFMMRKMENLKFSQIATRLNVSVSTVQKRVANALMACDAHLRAQGYDAAEFSNKGSRQKQPAGGLKAGAPVLSMGSAGVARQSDSDDGV